MDKMGDWEQNNLMKELAQGRELAMQLQIHLGVPSSSHETCEMLVQRILSSYEKALSMLNCSSLVQVEPHHAGSAIFRMSESPPSLSGSPRSEDSDREFKDQECKNGSTKRKTLPRWTQRVRVSPGTGLEGPLDDGFSWRKYGQKDILGAKYPRGYYRCTHRNVQGCLATKQVQRSDEDPMIFEVTYRGRHTCTQASHMINNPSSSSAAPPQQPPPPPLDQNQEPNNSHQQQQLSQEELLFNLRSGLKVITQDLDTTNTTNFHFPSTSNIKPEAFMGNFPPSFISPPTSSGTNNNYFSSLSPSEMNNQSFQNAAESDFTEIISSSAPMVTSSATNSPTVGFDFPFGNVEYDPNFTFDNPGFFN